MNGVRGFRVILAGVAAAVAWWLGMLLFFGPAQAILASPRFQSAKFLGAFGGSPPPRMAESPLVLPLGLLVIGLVFAGVYAWLAPRLPGGRLRRGAAFGLVAWLLMVPWFEFYLPWNVMREPFPLVLLEMACWFGVMQLVGVAVALAYGARES